MQSGRYSFQRADSSPRASIRVQTPSSTNQARSSSTTKSRKKSGSTVSPRAPSPQSPLRKSHSNVAQGIDSTSAFTCEQVLYGQLVALKSILLKSTSSRTFHDFSVLQNHIENRAIAAVEEDVASILQKLVQLRGPNQNHRITAYSQLLTSLTNEVESAVFNIDRRAVTNMKNDQQAVKVQIEQQQAVWNDKIARKDQTILAMQAEHAAMDFKNKSLVRAVELLSKELEKCNMNLSSVHQRSVELQIQAIDFKAEVDKRAQRVQQSILSRVGFVPDSIQKQINLLTSLMPPGDVNYDKVRMDIYKRHVAAGGSAPGTPTSTTRKSLAQLQLQLPGPATHASPRSSFTSSSPTSTTNFSISNTPPRSFHAPNNSASATSAAAPATTATMAPLPSGRSSVHDRKDNEIATATATVTTTAAPSVATPVMSTSISNNNSSSIATPQSSEVHRRQMLITSLFPRSVTVQDSTGIEGISFQPAAVSPAKEEAATAPSSSSSAQAPPAPGNAGRPAKADLCGAEETRSGRSGVVARANNNYEGEDCVISDAQEMAQEDGYDSDEGDCYDSSSDADVDEAETRTNPSASLRSYSLYDNDDAEEEGGGVSERGDAEFKPTEDHHHGRVRGIAHQVDDSVWHGSGSSSEQDSNSSVSSTSAGADDELPNSPHPHTAGAGAGGGGVGGGMAHMQHNIPHTTTTTHHHAKGGVSRGGALTSESDEGNDFYANMQKFIRGFQESHLVDISDSEVDFDHQRPNNAVATAPGTGIAASSKRRASAAAKSKSGHSHAHGHTNGAKTAKNDLTDKSGRVVTLVSDAPPAHGKKSSKR